jgi:hypothetical protein
MRFYTNPHPFYCGIDLHARSLYVCIVSQGGESLLHRHMKAAPEPFLKAIAPSREGLGVAVEGIFTWYWLADLCADEGIPFVLGHALYRKASHGGKAKNDKIDSHKIAALLRGGMLPQADVYPAAMRATRDLLRRRTHPIRKRAELLSHVQHTNSQDNVPEIGKQIDYTANREGVAERFADPAGQKTIELDLASHDLLCSAPPRPGALYLAHCQATRRHHPLLVTNRTWHGQNPQPRAALLNPPHRPIPQHAGVRFGLPPGHMQQGIGRQTLGDVWQKDR